MNDRTTSGSAVIDSGQREQRRRALRALIAHPVLRERERPELFAQVLRHQVWLRDWFDKNTGWSLGVDRSGRFGRLYKVPASPDRHRGLQTARGRDFDRRRYTLLCLVMAVLEEAAGQTTLRMLAEQVAALSAADPELPSYEPVRLPERRALVDALSWLERAGVLTARDGDAERYARSAAADALYDVDERLLGRLIASAVPPSLAAGPEELALESYAESPEGQRRRARHGVLRRLIDDPVVYHEDLTAAERDWLDHSRGFVYPLLEDELGLQPERRREGIAAVDPAGDLSDERFPDGSSTVKHAALLLCELLPEAAAGGMVAETAVADMVRELMTGPGRQGRWSSVYTSDAHGAAHLAEDAVDLLCGFGLARRQADGVRPLPAMARFRPEVDSGRGG